MSFLAAYMLDGSILSETSKGSTWILSVPMAKSTRYINIINLQW